MEDTYNKISNNEEPETVFSKTVLTGKRIYYLDVKKNKNGKFFLILTESKKVLNKDTSQPTFLYEKHKIFLLREDFDKFISAMNETIAYIKAHDSPHYDSLKNNNDFTDPIDIPLDF